MSDKDISMNIKMGQKTFRGMKNLEAGQKIDESQITPICDFVDERYDCADFRVLPLLKTLYAYEELLSDETNLKIKETLLNFKYWMDEEGEDSMCYWSENHQLLFHTCEYLAGNMFLEEIFTNSGLSGREHIKKAQWKLLQWLEHKWKYGFIEWHSNTYYEEDIAPLAMLVDYAPDSEISKKSAIILDLLLLDIAMFSFDGYFSSSSGRCYEKGKKDGERQSTRDIYEHAFGNNDYEFNYEKISTLFTLSKKYKVPKVLKAISQDKSEIIIKDSQGLDLKELKHEFEINDKGSKGAIVWQMESFTNPETIELTLDMINEYKMQSNAFLKDFKMINSKLLRKSGLLPFLIRLVNPSTQGIAIQRSNNYTFKTKHFMLSTALRHHPGEFGDQQHIWHAVMPGNIQIFTTHPGAPFFDDNARNFSPDYWVGNGIMPDSIQHENISMSIYKTDFRKGFLERKRLHYTHAFFPRAKFDEVISEKTIVFGRKGDSYIALISPAPLEWKNEEEIIQHGKVTAWVCHLSSNSQSGSFGDFIAEVKRNKFAFKEKNLVYKDISFTYKKEFTVNGEEINPQVNRYDSPYIKAKRKPEEMIIQYNGKSLKLNFSNMVREEF